MAGRFPLFIPSHAARRRPVNAGGVRMQTRTGIKEFRAQKIARREKLSAAGGRTRLQRVKITEARTPIGDPTEALPTEQEGQITATAKAMTDEERGVLERGGRPPLKPHQQALTPQTSPNPLWGNPNEELGVQEQIGPTSNFADWPPSQPKSSTADPAGYQFNLPTSDPSSAPTPIAQDVYNYFNPNPLAPTPTPTVSTPTPTVSTPTPSPSTDDSAVSITGRDTGWIAAATAAAYGIGALAVEAYKTYKTLVGFGMIGNNPQQMRDFYKEMNLPLIADRGEHIHQKSIQRFTASRRAEPEPFHGTQTRTD